MSIPPAWHPDPTGRHDHRWWDGTRWTEHIADAGVSGVDPLDGGAGPAVGDSGAGGRPGSAEASPDDGAGGPAGGWGQPDQARNPAGGWGQPDQAGGPAGGWGGAQQPGTQGWPAGPTGHGPTGSDGLAIAAGVIGIVSLVLSVFILGGIGGIVAIVLGAVAMSRVKKSGRKGRGMAITGLVTGIVSVVLSVVVFFFILGVFQDYDRCVELTDDPDSCREMSELFGAAEPTVA